MSRSPDNPLAGPFPGGPTVEPFGPADDISAFDLDLQDRLKDLTDRMSHSEVARLTNTPRQSCRRYLVHGKPSIEFLADLCESFGVSAHWLLLGVGPRTSGEDPEKWLRSISGSELLLELGRRWQGMERALRDLQASVARLEDPPGSSPAQSQGDGAATSVGFVEPKPL